METKQEQGVVGSLPESIEAVQVRYDEAKDWLVIVESLCAGKLRYGKVRRSLSECRQRVEDLRLKVSETVAVKCEERRCS